MTTPKIHWLKFPWILLWALPATSVVAGITTVIIAFTHQDDMVVDAYYKKGMSYNRDQNADKQARASEINAQWVYLNGKVLLTASGIPSSTGVNSLLLNLSHPLVKSHDREVQLTRVSEFQFEGTLDIHESAHWYIELTPNNKAWRLRGQWDGKSASQLKPEVL